MIEFIRYNFNRFKTYYYIFYSHKIKIASKYIMEKLYKIRHLQRAIIQYETLFEKKYGVCLNDGMALFSLKKHEKLSSGEIGALLGLTNSNTSKVINSIEDKGYVTRVIGDKDKRQMYFSLIAKGFELISAVKCV